MVPFFMKKKTAKIVMDIAGALILATAASIFYLESIDLPQDAQPDTGSIYAVSQHGSFRGYITHREKVLRELSLGLFGFFVVVYAITGYYSEPFERRSPLRRTTGYSDESVDGRNQ
jgi:hypothetical protein